MVDSKVFEELRAVQLEIKKLQEKEAILKEKAYAEFEKAGLNFIEGSEVDFKLSIREKGVSYPDKVWEIIGMNRIKYFQSEPKISAKTLTELKKQKVFTPTEIAQIEELKQVEEYTPVILTVEKKVNP